MEKLAIFWFRRDLRLEDNTALFYALSEQSMILPIFIFDTHILDPLKDKTDARVSFIHQTLSELKKKIPALLVKIGQPLAIFHDLIQQFDIQAVYANHDYEPYAQQRDEAVRQLLEQHQIPFRTYKDQCVFEKSEIVKEDKNPYTVFTPYSKKWKATLTVEHLKTYPSETLTYKFYTHHNAELPTLANIGFLPTTILFPNSETTLKTIKEYAEKRDFPATDGTSKLGVHLRFGTRSVRELVRKAYGLSEVWLNELIWREFYMMILWHFPQVAKQAFKPEYDVIEWRKDETDFVAWCEGKTGYPLVDAGMRELNATGYMHNRVRMVTASFLIKHLLIDWRWGEQYFAQKLLDFDLAANNGGWQWVAGSGCDGAPYFRVFNPMLQAKKFDPQSQYIQQWIPEWKTGAYPNPIVDHEFARKRVIEAYKQALSKKA